jgi:hypothetical protein
MVVNDCDVKNFKIDFYLENILKYFFIFNIKYIKNIKIITLNFFENKIWKGAVQWRSQIVLK